VIKVKLKDFSAKLGDFVKLSIEKKKKAVVRGVARSIPDLVAASPVDTGLYAASWDFTVEENSVILGNHAPYAGIIEYGTRRFKPPIGPLLAWAKRVLTGATWQDKNGDDYKVKPGQPETDYSPEVWALAIHTQKLIEERGMLPKHILQDMIPKVIENIRLEAREIVNGR